jgi:hypothetical protein
VRLQPWRRPYRRALGAHGEAEDAVVSRTFVRNTVGVTARPFVELAIPPYGGELDSWGKDPRGQWWGLVTWYEEVVQLKQMGRSTVLPCSGWVAARHLRMSDGEDYAAVPRVELAEHEALWPQPTDRGPHFWWSDKAHHVGILTERQYELPEGYAKRGVSPA